eukprot:Gb_32425 [translate_table: standard]
MAEIAEKKIIVGIDDSEQSKYALEWTVDHLIAPFAGNPPFKLVLVHALPHASSVLYMAGPGVADVLTAVEIDLKKIGLKVMEEAKEFCQSRLVRPSTRHRRITKAFSKMVEGDARNVLCEAVEKHKAEILVVGSHGYGAIKRAVLGSVSDYCAHHAHCTVMIVKKPKH